MHFLWSLLLAALSYPFMTKQLAFLSNLFHRTQPSGSMSSPSSSAPSRLPTYFLSIGGPNFIENTQHPAYAQLRAVGQEITHNLKPKAIVVLSAHWQADGPNQILVNAAEDAELIYDFYGFPKSYYEVEYPNRGSREVAEKVMDKLERSGIEVEGVRRGLDHGVWVGFLAGTYVHAVHTRLLFWLFHVAESAYFHQTTLTSSPG